MITSRKSLLCAGLLAATVASGAFAQAPAAAPAAQDPSAAQAPAKGPRGREDRAQRFEQMKQRHAQHLAALKEKLKLTPAQEGAWNTFAQAQELPPAPPAGARMNRDEFAKLTTPQRLDLMEKRRAERSAMFTRRADATRTFYAGLTPEQQKTFDAESMRRFGPDEHGGPRHPHHPAAPAKS
ncbi:Spy/CpxP family protein refolding chaperone [Variovorax ureilyticus]|uniref:Spy/CpxP family protein refolding chaperone n=1 Tax=Variovorax ureilyticus TaxID=1836198 RepID=A0ABU8VEM9_9BURK